MKHSTLRLAAVLLPLVPLLWLLVDWRCQRPEWPFWADVREQIVWWVNTTK